jgi:RHS repeat-associated protein
VCQIIVGGFFPVTCFSFDSLRTRSGSGFSPSKLRCEEEKVSGTVSANSLLVPDTFSFPAGTLVERYAYTAYGELTILAPDRTVRTNRSFQNRYTDTGREWDPTLRLYYFRARWLEPKAGRFIGRDPLGYVDGMGLDGAYFAIRGVDPLGTDDHHWFAKLGKKGQDLVNAKCTQMKVNIDDYTTYYEGVDMGHGLSKDTPHGYIEHELKYNRLYKILADAAPDCCTLYSAVFALQVYVQKQLSEKYWFNGGFGTGPARTLGDLGWRGKMT